jgi:hypothetical protein
MLRLVKGNVARWEIEIMAGKTMTQCGADLARALDRLSKNALADLALMIFETYRGQMADEEKAIELQCLVNGLARVRADRPVDLVSGMATARMDRRKGVLWYVDNYCTTTATLDLLRRDLAASDPEMLEHPDISAAMTRRSAELTDAQQTA